MPTPGTGRERIVVINESLRPRTCSLIFALLRSAKDPADADENHRGHDDRRDDDRLERNGP
jgi:hypothetical protein